MTDQDFYMELPPAELPGQVALFRAPRSIFKLQFEDPALAELVVRVRSISMGELLTIANEAESAKQGADLGSVMTFLDKFASSLVSWNLANEEGEATPASLAGLLSHEPPLVLAVTLAWFDSMASVPAPLGKALNSGSPFPEDSLPME